MLARTTKSIATSILCLYSQPRSFGTIQRMSKSNSSSSANDDGIVMVLSPAKTLDMSPYTGTFAATATDDPATDSKKTASIAKSIQRRTKADLQKVMKLSAKLAQSTFDQWQDFAIEKTNVTAVYKLSIFAFAGDVFQGLAVQECSDDAILYMQQNLRTLDAVYGILRPFDLIQWHRLEMHAKLTDVADKLGDYWKSDVTGVLLKDLSVRTNPVLLNLASEEYAAAVDFDKLQKANVRIVKAIFHTDSRNVTIHTKRARGLMARFVAQNKCRDIDSVRKFNLEGYALVESDSNNDDDILVFNRSKAAAAAALKRNADTKSDSSSNKKQKR